MYPLEKIILFEIDKPLDRDMLINFEAGIWYWKMVNTVETVTDNRGVTGYYQYQNETKYNINSLVVNNIAYTKVASLEELRITDSSFFYNTSEFNLYIHFEDFEPMLDKEVNPGNSLGYSKLPNERAKPYYGGSFYEPLLMSAPKVDKSIDPLFFGLLKYGTLSVELINSEGQFDDWRSRDLYGQPARMKVGDVDDDYDDFLTVFEGFVEDDSRTFDSFKVKVEDPRKRLTQPIATNKLTLTDWPDLSDSNENKVKPVCYGKIFNAESICLNEEEISPTYRTFLICDTEYNAVSSLDNIYVDGTLTAITGTADLTAGTFTMTLASVSGNEGDVTIDFTATSTYDGVTIVKDLMLNYDGKPFIASLWDTTEVNAASARNTGLYIDSGSKKLSEGIEDVCKDCDLRFFNKNDGRYTIRVYDANRTPNTREIQDHEYMNNPSIANNGSEFLSSVIINYQKNQKDDEYLIYENANYKDEVFDRYKKYKTTDYDTMLPTLTDAQDKSETIMNISKNVQDIVKRSANWDNYGIEPSDFIICSPATRESEDSVRGIYEVMKISNDLKSFTLGLSLRYVKAADDLATYDSIDDNNDSNILDNNGFSLIGRVS